MLIKIYRKIINKLANIGLKFQHSFLYRLSLLSARLLFLVNQERAKQAQYLILDVSSEGSLGDEAMIIGSINFLKDQGIKEVGILSVYNRTNWQGYDKITFGASEVTVNFFSLDFTNNSGSLYSEFLKIAQQYTHFAVPGADVMDGYYSEDSPLLKLRLISLSSAMGLKSSILGFSFNNQPRPSCVAAFQKLPADVAIFARDPFSKVRFENHINRQINLASDLAFLLEPKTATSIINQAQIWIEDQKSCGNIIVGINPNKTLATSLNTNTPSELAKIFSNLIQNLINARKNIAFVLIPHDYRQNNLFPGDDTLCQLIVEQLPKEIQQRCFLFKEHRLKAPEVKHICQYLDLVITSRMHLAIACLGVKTPVLGIVYQGKFAGLYSYFELDGMLIEPADAVQSEQLLYLVISGIENRDKIKQQIADKIPYVVELAKQNFGS